MGSTARFNTGRALFLQELAKAWDEAKPDGMTFGQLLAQSIPLNALAGFKLEHMTDQEILGAIRKFARSSMAKPDGSV